MSSTATTLSRAPRPSSLADVLDLILDKGLVIDAYVRVSLVGIEILTIDARIVVASVDTYLHFAEAVNRLDLPQTEEQGLPGLFGGGNEEGDGSDGSSGNRLGRGSGRSLPGRSREQQGARRGSAGEALRSRGRQLLGRDQPEQPRGQEGRDQADDEPDDDESGRPEAEGGEGPEARQAPKNEEESGAPEESEGAEESDGPEGSDDDVQADDAQQEQGDDGGQPERDGESGGVLRRVANRGRWSTGD